MNKYLIAAALLTSACTASHGKSRARNARVMQESVNSLSQLSVSVIFYTREHKDRLPPLKSSAALRKALSAYPGASASIFTSPATRRPYKLNSSLSGRALKSIRQPARVVLAYEAVPIPGPNRTTEMFRVACFVDGHVKAMPEAQWASVKRGSGIK